MVVLHIYFSYLILYTYIYILPEDSKSIIIIIIIIYGSLTTVHSSLPNSSSIRSSIQPLTISVGGAQAGNGSRSRPRRTTVSRAHWAALLSWRHDRQSGSARQAARQAGGESPADGFSGCSSAGREEVEG